MNTELPILEVERRYHATGTQQAEIVEQLLRQGFDQGSTLEQVDVYFTSRFRDLIETEECVRVRSTASLTEITWKPPTSSEMRNSHDFWKEEVDLPTTADPTIAVRLLTCLDFVEYVTVRKRRTSFLKNGVEVGVDDVEHAGTFVEIEVKSADVADAQQKIEALAHHLGLSDDDVSKVPYRDLVKRGLDERG